jgi:hypothetical protein
VANAIEQKGKMVVAISVREKMVPAREEPIVAARIASTVIAVRPLR